MRKFVHVVILLSLVMSTLAGPWQAVTAAAAPPAQRPTSLQVNLTSEPIEVIETNRPEGTFTSFQTRLPLMGEPGTPALPVVSKLVGIPTTVAPTLNVSLGAAQALPSATHAIEPNPSYSVLSPDGTSQEESLQGSYALNESAYRGDGWYPANPVKVSQPYTLRGQAVVRVEFTPIQVNLATGEIRQIASADATLSWDASAMTTPVETRDDPLWEDFYASNLDNYEQARAWRLQRGGETSAGLVSGGENRWIIHVEEQGLYKIPLSQLGNVGVPISDPTKLAMYYKWGADQEELALWIDGNNLYFVNNREHGFWSREVTYNLTVLATGTGLRMTQEAAAPTQATTLTQVSYSQRFEEEKSYNAGNTITEPGERWYWDILIFHPQNLVDTFTTTFDLPHLVPNTAASVYTELSPDERRLVPCYRGKVGVNSTTMAEYQWTGYNEFGQTLNIPAGGVTATGNTYTVSGIHCPANNSGSAGKLAFNAFIVDYQRSLVADGNVLRFDEAAASQNYEISGYTANDIVAFEVSDTNAPVLLTGGAVSGSGSFTFKFGRGAVTEEEYLVTTKGAAQAITSIEQYIDRGIRSDLRQTDWVLITHPDFINAVQPLAAYRQAQGLTTRVVNVEDIYNDFGDGSADPEAIRAFIKFAYQSWTAPALSYVFIVGDGTYDPLDYQGYGAKTWVPPIFRYADIYLGDAPADNAYVNALDEGDDPNTDPVPDVHIGRMTPNSVAEVDGVVQKIITYENDDSPYNSWKQRVLFTADNPDAAGNFHQLSERTTGTLPGYPRLLPDNLELIRAYFKWDPDGGGPLTQQYTSALQVRDTIARVLNQGALLIQYIGHGAPDQWSGDGGFWTLRTTSSRDDMALLEPTDRYAFALPWTCWEGYFVHPTTTDYSLSEEMTRLPDRGFIGSISPTGLDIAEGHDIMTDSFYQHLFGGTEEEPVTPTTNIGELMLNAKMPVIGTSVSRLAYTYMLYGDPAMDLVVPTCLEDGSQCVLDGIQYLPLSGADLTGGR